MREPVWRACAKSRPKDYPTEFLSLVDHSCDVAAVFTGLVGLPPIAARLGRLAGRELTAADRARLSVLVALHDAGKANVWFQNRLRGCKPETGHIAPLVSLLYGDVPCLQRRFAQAIGFDTLQSWAGDIGPLLDAIVAHHGSLPEPGIVEPRMWQETPQYKPFAALAELCNAVREWFPEAFGAVFAPLPCQPRFLHALAGLVMLADWLASDDRRFAFSCDGAPAGVERVDYVPQRQSCCAIASWIRSLGEKRRGPSPPDSGTFSPR
jgi:CRISPR-associated endonuclease/helicase Cas3